VQATATIIRRTTRSNAISRRSDAPIAPRYRRVGRQVRLGSAPGASTLKPESSRTRWLRLWRNRARSGRDSTPRHPHRRRGRDCQSRCSPAHTTAPAACHRTVRPRSPARPPRIEANSSGRVRAFHRGRLAVPTRPRHPTNHAAVAPTKAATKSARRPRSAPQNLAHSASATATANNENLFPSISLVLGISRRLAPNTPERIRTSDLLSENRGVPGSSPGLAIARGAARRDSRSSGPSISAAQLDHGLGHGPLPTPLQFLEARPDAAPGLDPAVGSRQTDHDFRTLCGSVRGLPGRGRCLRRWRADLSATGQSPRSPSPRETARSRRR
jgi:hypothetical protein